MTQKRKTFSVKSKGNSMFPLLQDGDIVEYVQTSFGAIKENDIILAQVGKVFITHRVLYKTNSYCIMRGDNNPSADMRLKKSHVFARAVRFKRNKKWHEIQDIYMKQSIMYLHEIDRLETKLNKRNAPHIFLKGVLVSLRYENGIPKRIYADCDILVKRNDSHKIETIFRSLGYRYAEKKHSLVSKKSKFDYPEISYVKDVGGIPVVFDVHFEPVFLMTQLSGMDFLYKKSLLQSLGDEMLTHRKRVNIKGKKFFLCSSSHQILYLVLHIFHHNFGDSVRYSLLHSTIKKTASESTWKNLEETIKEYRLQGYAYLTFMLLKKYYKTSIPPSFLHSIAPSWGKKYFSKFLLNKINIFNQDVQLNGGVKRFIFIYTLSPEPIWKRVFILFHPDAIHSVYFILKNKIVKSLK